MYPIKRQKAHIYKAFLLVSMHNLMNVRPFLVGTKKLYIEGLVPLKKVTETDPPKEADTNTTPG